MNADVAAVIAHFSRFGAPTQVIDRHVAGGVALDLHVVPPHDDDRAWTLFTTGMSAHPMAVPEPSVPARAELAMRLPATWTFDAAAWPVRWLEVIARVPHDHATWLALGHTIPNGDPPRPFADDTALCCMMLVAPTWLADGDDVIATPSGAVAVMSVMPIYREEMALKLADGATALLARLDAAGIDETIELARANVALAPTSQPTAKIRHSKRR